VAHIQNDAGSISRFRQPEREASDIQLMGGLHKARESGNYAPRDQDACYPYASSDSVQDEIAGDLEQKVTPKENPVRESELLAVMASSRFIVSATNPMLTRSRKATT